MSASICQSARTLAWKHLQSSSTFNAWKGHQFTLESKRSERSEGCCINPSGRNRTSDQLISEHTDTQHPTLQSIALPTELHSVLHAPHAKRNKKTYTHSYTNSHSFADAHHSRTVLLRLFVILSACSNSAYATYGPVPPMTVCITYVVPGNARP